MSTHTDLLNYIVQKRNVQAYLEIGVRNPADNFDQIKGPNLKVGVDPDPNAHATHQMTSDEFFAQEYAKLHPQRFGLIFIDGLHHAEQVQKDILNAIGLLTDDGVVVCHDCLPDSEHTSRRLKPDEPVTGAWTGDVWKGFAKTCSTINGHFFTLDADWGCGVIDFSKPRDIPETKVPSIESLTWQDYLANRQEWLNIKPYEYVYEAV